MLNRHRLQICLVPQRGIEGKPDLVPDSDIPGGPAVIVPMTAFEIPEMAHIVDRRIRSRNDQRWFARAGQGRALEKQRIEDHRSARLGFAPDTEMPRELLAQDVARGNIRLDCKSDGGRRPRVRRPPDAPSEHLFQHAGDDRQFAATSRDIQCVKTLFFFVLFDELFGCVNRPLDQRPASLIVINGGNGYFPPSIPHGSQIDDDPPRVRMKCFLACAALFVQSKNLRLGKGIERNRRAFESEIREHDIEVIAADIGDSFAGHHRMKPVFDADKRCIERAAAQDRRQAPTRCPPRNGCDDRIRCLRPRVRSAARVPENLRVETARR